MGYHDHRGHCSQAAPKKVTLEDFIEKLPRLLKEQTKGVISFDEAVLRWHRNWSINIVKSRKHSVFFFTDQYLFGTHVLPSDFVHSNFKLPMSISPRPGFESGIIETVDQYYQVFLSDLSIIGSNKALITFVNERVFK